MRFPKDTILTPQLGGKLSCSCHPFCQAQWACVITESCTNTWSERAVPKTDSGHGRLISRRAFGLTLHWNFFFPPSNSSTSRDSFGRLSSSQNINPFPPSSSGIQNYKWHWSWSRGHGDGIGASITVVNPEEHSSSIPDCCHGNAWRILLNAFWISPPEIQS